VKTLIVAAALLVTVACGETPGASSESSPCTPTCPAAETSPPAESSAPAAESPPPAQTVITFLNAPLTASRGQNATLKVRTAPNTPCSIEVDYKSGPSTAAGLIPKTSDGAGNVSWTWMVGANTTPGAWPITVTCGDSSAQTHITVT
jgi:micrococcal nuclease